MEKKMNNEVVSENFDKISKVVANDVKNMEDNKVQSPINIDPLTETKKYLTKKEIYEILKVYIIFK
jgi:hypothetical protein